MKKAMAACLLSAGLMLFPITVQSTCVLPSFVILPKHQSFRKAPAKPVNSYVLKSQSQPGSSDNAEPYVYADRDAGIWVYTSNTLQINIRRKTDIDQGIIWYETYIYGSENDRLYSILTKNVQTEQSPVVIANQAKAVLAFSDDYFGNRRQKNMRQGIIIRNGRIISNDTYSSGSHHFPNLDVMALFKDGRLATYESNKYSADEYVTMGVTDTYSFGPILVQDGKIDERLTDAGYMPYLDPRCALGMIEPHRYIVLTVEGRTVSSKGVRLSWLAQKMHELGAVEAINLDGGNTTALVFMGDLINHRKDISEKNIRYLTSMIGIGTR